MAVPPADSSQALAEAAKLRSSNPTKAEETYKSILSQDTTNNEAAIKNLESALLALGELYRDQRRADDLANLILHTRDSWAAFAKAKTAKLGTDSHHKNHGRR